VRGTSSLVPEITKLARQYEQNHPSVAITVVVGGSSSSIERVEQGEIDIALSSRARTVGDAATLKFIPIERQALAIAVNAANPIRRVTPSTAQSLLTGRVLEWKALGWTGGDEVRVYARGATTPTGIACRAAFERRASRREAPLALATNKLVRAVIAADPQGVACITVPNSQSKRIRLLSVGGRSFTKAALVSGRYPYAVTRYIVTSKATAPQAVAFASWLASHDVQCRLVSRLTIPAAKCP